MAAVSFGYLGLLAAPAMLAASIPTLGVVPLWFPLSFYFLR